MRAILLLRGRVVDQANRFELAAVYSRTTSMGPTMLVLKRSMSPAGIQYSRDVGPPTWWTSYWLRKSRFTQNDVTAPYPESRTFQSRAILSAYAKLRTG